MATTGLWAIKASLRNVLNYASNPDKTIEKKYLDKDLAAVIDYAAEDEKTDQKMYVSGINCIPPLALESMMETKRQFGKEGGNVAYHGYQSFVTGGVTPEEAHEIGMETARRMWGDSYQVLVTTHLNTDNLHNHIVINSVSFKTGKKFQNKISDHFRFREISDEVCREHNKSVLENSPFYQSDKKEYWLHQAGKLTRKDILRNDIDEAIRASSNFRMFNSLLNTMGYRYSRGPETSRPSIIADGWKRAIRLDYLGKDYTIDKIEDRMANGEKSYAMYQDVYYRYRSKPMQDMLRRFEQTRRMDGIQVMFLLFTELLKLVTGNNVDSQKPQPMSPRLRAACVQLNQYTEQVRLLEKYNLDSDVDISRFLIEKNQELFQFYEQRDKTDNKIRRCREPEEKTKLKEERSQLSAKIKPLRKEVDTAKGILVSLDKMRKLLQAEMEVERGHSAREKTRGR